MARHGLASDAFAMLWRYGARDYRNIGHKAIYVANAQRTLQTIGWQHAEPVLRSLVQSLSDFGPKQQVNGYAFDDQCYGGNLKLVKDSFAKLPSLWTSDEAAGTLDVLETIRKAKPDEACAEISARLVQGKTNAAGVWDAAHLAAAELRMRTGQQRDRWPARGQLDERAASRISGCAGFSDTVPAAAASRRLGGTISDRLPARAKTACARFRSPSLEPSAKDAPLEEIFANVPAKADAAASQVLRLAANPASRRAYLAAALRSTAAKADEVHFYKYLAALMEDAALAQPRWQPHLIAATAYYLKGSNDAEPAAMKRAREALKSLPA